MAPTTTDEGQLASSTALSKIVDKFPQEHLVYAFGYGSGVFSQNMGDQNHEGMLDMIFVVDEAYEFHNANLQVYPHHYATWLRYSGPSMINRMQQNFFLKDAKVLFHVVDQEFLDDHGL